jgi:uncharacterized protein
VRGPAGRRRRPLVTTALVIAEAACLIDRRLGPQAEASPYDSVLGGQLEVASLDTSDWERIRKLVTTYASLRLGGTDASVATLNHRHFRAVRPRHANAFELLP